MNFKWALRWEAELWPVVLSRAWPFPDVKGDLEQWEDLSVGTGNPREEHGP